MDILKLDALVAALKAYQEADVEVEECFEKCKYSPDYHCRDKVDARREAAEEFGRRLNALVDERVQEALAARKGAA